jgi:hypothetical protein
MQFALDKLGALSLICRYHTFDISADGYARDEGYAALHLKKSYIAILQKPQFGQSFAALLLNRTNGQEVSRAQLPQVRMMPSERPMRTLATSYSRIQHSSSAMEWRLSGRRHRSRGNWKCLLILQVRCHRGPPTDRLHKAKPRPYRGTYCHGLSHESSSVS